MNTERENYQRQQKIFLVAVELASPEERASYLDEVCGSDTALRETLESLIREYHEAGETSLGEEEAGTSSEPFFEESGTMIGRYKILERIGEGGFGVVYMAEQTEPVVRRVALKVIKPGMDSREIIARFEAERQALAMMDDPNIAKILDAGATESNRPYFVMELVKGIPITQFCKERRLDTRQRLDIFLDVCSAVQHAHQKGIIHRDLKPSNILVTLRGDKPVPKVIDFGIAKATHQQLTDKTLFTRFHQFVGTPVYMSPEQAALSEQDIDTRSDIYALGVLLYELLTGAPPFDARSLISAGYDEMRRVIREDEPPKPSARLRTTQGVERATLAKEHRADPHRLDKPVRGDLDWIVMKAIEKDPARRYETANGFGEDVRRHLNNEPVIAAAPTVRYKVQKFVRRNRGAVTAAATISLLLIVGIAAIMWFAIRANSNWTLAQANEKAAKLNAQKVQESEKQTKIALRKLQRQVYTHYLARAQDALATGDTTTVQQLLEECPEELRGWEWQRLHWQAERSVQTFREHLEGEVDARTFLSFDGRRVAVSHPDETIKIWSVPELEEMGTLVNDGGVRRTCFAFSPVEDWVAAGCDDGTVRIWDGRSGLLRETMLGHKKPVGAVAFSSDGAFLVSGDVEGNVKLWKSSGGKLVRTLEGNHVEAQCLAFSSDGEFVGVMNATGAARTWRTSTGDPVHNVNNSVQAITYHKWGKQTAIAMARLGGDIAMLDIETGKLLKSIGINKGQIKVVQFSPDGRRLLVSDKALRICDTETMLEQRAHYGEIGVYQSAAFLSDDEIVAIAGDGSLLLWRLATEAGDYALSENGAPDRYVEFSPDGRLIASARHDGTATLWDAETGQQLNTLHAGGTLRSLAFRPDGKQLATASFAGQVKLWNVETNALEKVLSGNESFFVSSASYSPDGKLIATANWDGKVRIWETSSGHHLGTYTGHSAAVWWVRFSPDGDQVVSGAENGELRIWDPLTTETLVILDGHQQAVDALVYSPDGEQIASGGHEGTIKIWNSESGQLEHTLSGHGAEVSGLAYSPDGLRLFSIANEIGLKVWDPATGMELLSFPTVEAYYGIDVSLDGKSLVVSSHRSGIKILETGVPDCGYAARKTIEAARQLVDERFLQFGRLNFSLDVADDISSDPSLDATLRGVAAETATARTEDVKRLVWQGWQLSRMQGQTPQYYQAAQTAAEWATRLAPDSPAGWLALALAQLRLEKAPQALVSFKRGLAADWNTVKPPLGDIGPVSLSKFGQVSPLSRSPEDALWQMWLASMEEERRGDTKQLISELRKLGMRDSAPGAANANIASNFLWLWKTLDEDGAIRINCGGPIYTGPSGTVWAEDCFFDSGNLFRRRTSFQNVLRQVENTEDDTLFISERWFPSTGEYSFPLPDGTYRVKLHFAEINHPKTEPGMRVFDVVISGQKVLENFDPVATAGFATAVMREFTVSVKGTPLEINFLPLVENPKISAIEIIPIKVPGSSPSQTRDPASR